MMLSVSISCCLRPKPLHTCFFFFNNWASCVLVCAHMSFQFLYYMRVHAWAHVHGVQRWGLEEIRFLSWCPLCLLRRILTSLKLHSLAAGQIPGILRSLLPGSRPRPETTKCLFAIRAVWHGFSWVRLPLQQPFHCLSDLSLQPRVSLSPSGLHCVRKSAKPVQPSQKHQGSYIIFLVTLTVSKFFNSSPTPQTVSRNTVRWGRVHSDSTEKEKSLVFLFFGFSF